MDSDDGGSHTLTSHLESVCADPDIEFAVTFGSRTTGQSRPSSDLDIAVKFADELDSEDRFRKRCFLSGDLQQPEIPRVDLVDLESLPIEVAHDAVSGEFVCGDRAAFGTFKEDLETTYRAGRRDRRRRRRKRIDRIAEEGLRG
jgi:predicted nucleotidyltransferase